MTSEISQRLFNLERWGWASNHEIDDLYLSTRSVGQNKFQEIEQSFNELYENVEQTRKDVDNFRNNSYFTLPIRAQLKRVLKVYQLNRLKIEHFRYAIKINQTIHFFFTRFHYYTGREIFALKDLRNQFFSTLEQTPSLTSHHIVQAIKWEKERKKIRKAAKVLILKKAIADLQTNKSLQNRLSLFKRNFSFFPVKIQQDLKGRLGKSEDSFPDSYSKKMFSQNESRIKDILTDLIRELAKKPVSLSTQETLFQSIEALDKSVWKLKFMMTKFMSATFEKQNSHQEFEERKQLFSKINQEFEVLSQEMEQACNNKTSQALTKLIYRKLMQTYSSVHHLFSFFEHADQVMSVNDAVNILCSNHYDALGERKVEEIKDFVCRARSSWTFQQMQKMIPLLEEQPTFFYDSLERIQNERLKACFSAMLDYLTMLNMQTFSPTNHQLLYLKAMIDHVSETPRIAIYSRLHRDFGIDFSRITWTSQNIKDDVLYSLKSILSVLYRVY